jgi:hypothetical protein
MVTWEDEAFVSAGGFPEPPLHLHAQQQLRMQV